jgi:DNA-binding transcriptional MerR regulator
LAGSTVREAPTPFTLHRSVLGTRLDRTSFTYTIRQLCLEFGCTPRAVRFYEAKELLWPRRDGLNRLYSYQDRARLQLILRGKRLGLPLEDIRQILELYGKSDGNRAQELLTLKKYRERIVSLEAQQKDIESVIAELTASCELIEQRLVATQPPEDI